MIRPRVFIGSAAPRLTVANALQARLEPDFLVTVWDQRVIRPSDYPIPSLLKQCEQTDFAIEIFAPDVVQRDKSGNEVFAPNPNVLLELGLFMGALGQKNVYVLAPRTFSSISMPSNLAGLTLVLYDPDREDNNLDAALGSAAHELRVEMQQQWPVTLQERLPWHRVEMFQHLDPRFRELIRTADEFQSCYVHSRRWRENHGDLLRDCLRSGKLKRAVFFLPNITDEEFIRDLAGRFDDEPAIPGMIFDAFIWAKSLIDSFGERVRLSLFSKVPSYSFYRFNSAAIVAFYNLARARKPVPAIEARQGDQVWEYLQRDLSDFEKECQVVDSKDLDGMVASFRTKINL